MTRGMLRTLAAAWMLFACHAFAADAVEEQVAAATKEWIEAFNTRDAARISSLYAPDAVLWGTVSQTIRTSHGEILEYFVESCTKRPNLRMSLGEYHVQTYGEIATNSGYYTSRNPVDGKEVVIPMRFTFTYRREADRWVIVNHHSSRFASSP